VRSVVSTVAALPHRTKGPEDDEFAGSDYAAATDTQGCEAS
jgi:hypothetical protein